MKRSLLLLRLLLLVGAPGIVLAQGGLPEAVPTGVMHTIIVSTVDLAPATVEIVGGDTVAWFVVGTPATIAFSERTPVRRICGPPTLFRVTEEVTYTSTLVPAGDIARLCFADPGTYVYTVFPRPEGGPGRSPVKGRMLSGQIIVK